VNGVRTSIFQNQIPATTMIHWMCLEIFGGIISAISRETITALVLFAIASTSEYGLHVRA
jgi:hypothetical protein